jgi:hypothetical protein
VADAVIFVLAKNKELVLKSLSKGLRLPRPEDALGGYDRLANLYVDGIRSTIPFLGLGNDKIRGLKSENLVDDRFVKKLEQEGRF